MARLGLARAYCTQGDTAKAAYQDFRFQRHLMRDRNIHRNDVGNRPNRQTGSYFSFMHCDFQRGGSYLDDEIVVIDSRVAIVIVRSALEEIRGRTPAASNKIGDPVMLLMLVIVDVAVQDNEAGTSVELVLLEHPAKGLFLGSGGMTTVDVLVRRAGVRRVMKDEENEID